MPFDIDFSQLRPINPFQAIADGQKMAQEDKARQALNLFVTDPERGAQGLVAAGRPDLADSALRTNEATNTLRAKRVAQPFLAKQDYAGAAGAAAPYDTDFSHQLTQMSEDGLNHAQKMGERSASVLMAASALPDAQSRKAYIAQHADELSGLGYPPDKIANYDTTDPAGMRADAARFMSLSDLAGKTSIEKFGDNAVTYRTDPINGTRAVSRVPIPPTRAEQREEADSAWRRQHGDAELTLAQGKEAREAANQGNPSSTPAKVMGPIFDKLSKGGWAALTKPEQDAVRYYKMDPITAGAMSETGDEDAGTPPEGAAPQAGTTPAVGRGAPRPARAAPPAPTNAAQRTAGATYQTPRGPLKWTGTGWVTP